MSLAKKLGIGLGVVVGVVAVGAGGAMVWAKSAVEARLSKPVTVAKHDFPVPGPLSEAELAQLRAERTTPETPEGTDVLAGVDLAALAQERAVKRGKYLLEGRYACHECHGANLGGGKMIDDPAIGTVLGKNLTLGKGGVTAKYTPVDWDRMVRHGVKPDGKLTVMPSQDYAAMTDQELSDLVAYIRSLPPVDNEVPEVTFGPVGTMLMALGKINVAAETAPHDKPHALTPPTTEAPDYGKHVAQVCVGCHTPTFAGGLIPGGPPDWPPAKNLTPHAEGLAGWTKDDFFAAMRKGVGKNGAKLREPMASMPKIAEKMTDRDLEAMFAYLQALPPLPTPK